jgi:large conductance mechanosensitive channel
MRMRKFPQDTRGREHQRFVAAKADVAACPRGKSGRLLPEVQLRRIHLAPKGKTDMKIVEEFRTFAMRGSVIDLAVGVVVGAAFTAIVTSLVKDILTPPIGLALGGIDFTNFFIVLKGKAGLATLKAAQDAGAVTINYGAFIQACINFMIVAFVLFLIVRSINKFTAPKETATADAAPPAPSEDVLLLREIRDLLKTHA